ncbi:MAG: GYD domain-containing protein [Deltaproteobacteria bacterium]|nr:GYD domain-containing protein [Deltaproteobacteria bacterium]
MQVYVTLYQYKGSVKGGGPERFEKVKEIVADEKGRILKIYGLLGNYDALSVAEFPDNRTAMRAALRVGNLIDAQTNTMAAVEGDDFLQIMSEL